MVFIYIFGGGGGGEELVEEGKDVTLIHTQVDIVVHGGNCWLHAGNAHIIKRCERKWSNITIVTMTPPVLL